VPTEFSQFRSNIVLPTEAEDNDLIDIGRNARHRAERSGRRYQASGGTGGWEPTPPLGGAAWILLEGFRDGVARVA